MFVQNTETASCSARRSRMARPASVMDYYDGNTVTGLWNYAQNYAMSDNSFDTNFGPSTPGALNLISGYDGGSYAVSPSTGRPGQDPGTVSALNTGPRHHLRRPRPGFDDCSDASHTRPTRSAMTGPEHRRPAQRPATSPGAGSRAGSRPTGHEQRRLRGLRLHRTHEHRRRHGGGLHPAPRAVPVLQVHGEPPAPAADLGGRDRPAPTRPTTSTTCPTSTLTLTAATCPR